MSIIVQSVLDNKNEIFPWKEIIRHPITLLMCTEVEENNIDEAHLIAFLSTMTGETKENIRMRYRSEETKALTAKASSAKLFDREQFLKDMKSDDSDEMAIFTKMVDLEFRLTIGSDMNEVIYGLKLIQDGQFPDLAGQRLNHPRNHTARSAIAYLIKLKLDGALITDSGQLNYNHVDHLENIEGIRHYVLEQDSFGPLVCGVRTNVGMIIYG